jgi:hypothetical protein
MLIALLSATLGVSRQLHLPTCCTLFLLHLRVEEPEAVPEQPADLDPEALKDALLEKARADRRALVEAAMRPGTGRVPRRREFALDLPPLRVEQAEAEEQQQLEQGVGDYCDYEWQLAAGEVQMDGGHSRHPEWAAEAGVLAQQLARAAVQPADAGADPAGASAATPGAALLCQLGGELQQEMADSQLAQAKTPGASLLGRYSPMEGVPERLVLLATRNKQPPATVSRSLRQPACTPAGFTPMEGIPERLMALAAGPRSLGATRVCSNEASPAVDSPVEGLVQQGARACRDLPQPADASGHFAGFAQPSPPAAGLGQGQPPCGVEHQVTAEQPQQVGSDDDGDYGFADGGYDSGDADDDPAAGPGGFPFLGEPAAPMEDVGVQTGVSLADEEGAAAGEAGLDGAGEDGQHCAGGAWQKSPARTACTASPPSAPARTHLWFTCAADGYDYLADHEDVEGLGLGLHHGLEAGGQQAERSDVGPGAL